MIIFLREKGACRFAGQLLIIMSTIWACTLFKRFSNAAIFDSMLSNRPGGARIGPKIPDWMSYNLAGREK